LVHYFQPVAELELHGASDEAFELVEVTVDENPGQRAAPCARGRRCTP